MNKKKILSAVTLLTIATSSTIGMGSVLATQGNVQDIDKCVYFTLEEEEKYLTSEKLKELLESKGLILQTELTGNVGTGTQIQVTKDGISYEYIVVLLGDVNGDGRISTQDISMLRKHMIGSEEITDPIILKAMNVSGDEEGKISTQDVSRLRKMLIGSQVAIIPAEQMPDTKKDVAVQKLAKLSEYAQTTITEENYDSVVVALQEAKAAVETIDEEVAKTLEGYENIEVIENNIKQYEDDEDGKVAKDNAIAKLAELSQYIETTITEENYDSVIAALQEAKIAVETIDEEVAKTLEGYENIEVIENKIQAKVDALNVLSAYKAENYDEEDWETIKQEINDAKSFITNATTTEEIEAYLDETKSVIDSIKTKQEKLEEAIKNAEKELEEELGNYTSNNYETIQWDSMTNIVNASKEALKNLKTSKEATVADVDKIVNDAREALKVVETKLVIAQKQAIEELKAFLATEGKEAEYSEENWNKIKDIVNNAEELINNFSNTSDMNTDIENIGKIKEDTFYEIDLVLTFEKELENFKEEKINDIMSIATDLSKYSQEEQETIAELKSNAETLIGQANSFEEVEEKANETLAELLKYKTQAQKNAIDTINSKYVKTDYYSEDWEEMITIINEAKLDIDRALDNDLETILSTLDSKLSVYETIKEQLDKAIVNAYAELDVLYPTTGNDEGIYDTEVWSALQAELGNQKTIIGEQTTKTKVTIALENAKNKLKNDFKTVEEQTEAAREDALVKINAAFENYIEEDYSAKNWETLKACVTAAEEQINADDATISSIEEAKQIAIDGMENVLTKAEEELNIAINNAVKAVNAEYTNKYRNILDDYDNNGKKELNSILKERDTMKTLTSIEAVNEKRDDIITRMGNVKKIAQKELEQEFSDNYDEADYYTTDWEKIENLVNDAIIQIKASTTVGEPNTIKDKAIEDINKIDSKATILQNSKDSAISALEIFKEADYEETEWNEVDEIKTNACQEINKASTPSTVATIKDKAIEDINKCETSLQKVKIVIEGITNEQVEITLGEEAEKSDKETIVKTLLTNVVNDLNLTSNIVIEIVSMGNSNDFTITLKNNTTNNIIIATFTCSFVEPAPVE